MSSDWGPVLNSFLGEFEASTVSALEEINELLARSGKTFDVRIKDYIKRSVKNRLEQTLDFFDIQAGSYVPESGKNSVKDETSIHNNVKTESFKVENNSMEDSYDSIDIVEHKVNVETIEIVSTSTSNSSADIKARATQPVTYARIKCRSSLDSCTSDQRSTCSPSTSDQPMLSPIGTPDSTPNICPDLNINNIKKEPDDVEFTEQNFDECVVKMENVPVDPSEMHKSMESPSASRYCFDRSVSQISDPQSLKRQLSTDFQNELNKRPKSADDISTEPNPLREKNIVFACFYCHSQPSFFVDTFTEIYEHWKQSHGSISFRFFVVGMAACFYCGKVDVFPNLQGHHKHNHHSEIFVVVDKKDRNKCGLCQRYFSASEMVVHFRTHHDPCLLMGINNPVCFNQTEIEQLLTINSCREAPREVSFVCGHCNSMEKTRSFLQHIEHDNFQYKCTICNVTGKTIQETVDHEERIHSLLKQGTKHASGLQIRLERYYLRTRVIFNNGLVLFKHNLLNTSFDDRKAFWALKERMMKQKFDEINNTDEKLASRNLFAYKKELMKQRTYRNNVCIRGITTVKSDEILRKVFDKICTAMEKSTSDGIESIFQRTGKDIIVKFKNWESKKSILKQWERMNMSERLEKLQPLKIIDPNIELTQINVMNDLTDFFRLLHDDAQEAKNKNEIHSFWISEHGLSVKCTQKSPIDIIWSKSDLIRCIRRHGLFKN